jgi:hypothetical protein
MAKWGWGVCAKDRNRFGQLTRFAGALAVLVSALFLTVANPALASPSWQTSDLPAIVPGPPVTYPSMLSAESCPADYSCVAVGTFGGAAPLAETLSAGTWTASVLPTPANAAGDAQLTAVACVSVVSCVAVGSDETAVDYNEPIAETFNGIRWTATQLPLPFGDNGYGEKFGLNAVSCTSVTWCVAIGTAGFTDILNGTTWTTTSFPLSIAAPTSVSCVASDSCVAVLTTTTGPEVVTLSGSTWTTATLPAGSQASGISCTSMTSCVVVGGSGVDTLSGTTWTLSAVSFPDGAQSPSLSGVSCPSSTSCVAVGTYYLSGQDVNWPGNGVAETLSQGAWTDAPLAIGGAAGVSCTAALWCAEVGSMPQVINGQWADTLSNGGWTSVQLPLPASASDATLTGVSCPSVQSCTAVGSVFEASGGAVVPVAERLTGATWTASILPQPPMPGPNGPGPIAELNAVSCPSAVSCIAVGWYFDSSDGQFPLVDVLTSGVWKAEALPAPPQLSNDGLALTGISCLSATSCVAVGQLAYTRNAFAETLSGRRWRGAVLRVHENQPFMRGISCTAVTSCVAVGFAGRTQPIAALLTGTRWTVRNLPEPYGDGDTELGSVWCQSTAACMATGDSYVPVNRVVPIADELTARKWAATNLPVSGSPDVTDLFQGLSCASITSCVAVGATDGSPFVESLVGSTWSPSVLSPSSGDDGAVLNSVSCVSLTFCVAVGQGTAPVGAYPFVATYGAPVS